MPDDIGQDDPRSIMYLYSSTLRPCSPWGVKSGETWQLALGARGKKPRAFEVRLCDSATGPGILRRNQEAVQCGRTASRLQGGVSQLLRAFGLNGGSGQPHRLTSQIQVRDGDTLQSRMIDELKSFQPAILSATR